MRIYDAASPSLGVTFNTPTVRLGLLGAKADGEGSDVGDKVELRSLSAAFGAELYVSVATGYDPFGKAPTTKLGNLDASLSGLSLSATEWLTNEGEIAVTGNLKSAGAR